MPARCRRAWPALYARNYYGAAFGNVQSAIPPVDAPGSRQSATNIMRGEDAASDDDENAPDYSPDVGEKAGHRPFKKQKELIERRRPWAGRLLHAITLASRPTISRR